MEDKEKVEEVEEVKEDESTSQTEESSETSIDIDAKFLEIKKYVDLKIDEVLNILNSKDEAVEENEDDEDESEKEMEVW